MTNLFHDKLIPIQTNSNTNFQAQTCGQLGVTLGLIWCQFGVTVGPPLFSGETIKKIMGPHKNEFGELKNVMFKGD